MLHTRPNIHPGEILREEFLKPAGVDVDRLARDIKLPKDRLDQLVGGSGAVCVDTALRLSRYFGTSERFWLEMQMSYDLERARRAKSTIENEIDPLDAA
ncbi:MAG TPA: HigA family addiction module antitoxin [Candidatus Omnitrophota bacterium]|nr:HigA family addiction module antitoxin [Candidatus Omnitrophota bacterium]